MDRDVYARMDQLEAHHWWFVGRREIIRTAIERLIALPQRAAILEAGCGTGGNLAMLSSLGELDAFEYDDIARRRAEEKSDRTLPFGALPDQIPGEDRAYDLIGLFDVLEHVEADEASLAALGRRLSKDGRLILTVPAYGWLWSKHDERHHHFRRYTKASLKEAAAAAGMTVERSFYFNSFLFPVVVAVRALKAVLGHDTPDDDLPSPVMNRLLSRVFRTERHLVGTIPMPFGLSLCAVLRRADEA